MRLTIPVTGQANDLIAQDRPPLRPRPLLLDPVMRIRAQARDKENALARQGFEPGVIDIAPVENQHCARLKTQAAGHLDLLPFARRDDHQLRQVARMESSRWSFTAPLVRL